MLPARSILGRHTVTGFEDSAAQRAGLTHSPDREAGAVRGQLAIVGGAVTAIWLAALMCWVVTDTVVPWDSKNQFYAFFRFLAASANAGVPPFWNPYHYAGHPSAADPQSLVFAPAFLLWALIDSAPSIRTFDVIVFAHLLLGGLSVGAIGLRANWPAAACVLAAVVFMFGGAAAGRLQHTGLILSYALFPPALLLLQVALQRRSIAYGAAFAAVAAALALGCNQAALLLCYVLVAAALAEMLTAAQPLAYLRDRLPVLLVMALVGFALLIAPLLLTVQFAALSNRAAEALSDAHKGSLYPANLATLAVADIFGTHGTYWGPDGRTVPEVAYTDDSFNYMFVGAVPVVLLLWLGIAGGGGWGRGRVLLSASMVVALIYMLGRYTPLFAAMFDWMPGVSNFRRPADAGFVLIAMLAILTGHLLADYVRDGLPRGRIVAVAAVTAVAVAIVVWGVIFSYRFGHGGEALLAVLKAAPVLLAVIIVLAWARTPEARARAAVIVTAIAVAELLLWNIAFRLNAEARTIYTPLERLAGEDARAIAVLEDAIRARHAEGARPRIEVLGAGGPWQNLAMVRGFEAINGYNPLRIAVYDRLVAPGESNWLVELRDFPPTFDGYDSPLARALGLEFLVLGKPIEQVPNLKKPPEADVLLAGPERWVYQLLNPAPRVAFAAGPETGQARIVAWRPDRVEIDTDSAEGGTLVLHDHDYPGWFAEIDGKRVPIKRAETLFRGVDVPPGRHRVVFYFAPFSLENLKNALVDVLARAK
ncbi:MAG: YfhO family protein [Rhizobiales bacterium]|nr:YfhO family protein [Hyphomicrobiales bacterium]